MFDAITPTDFPCRFIRCRTIWLLRSLGFTLIAAIGWLAAPAISHAEVIDYVFSNASAVFNGTPESITGLFSIESVNPLPEEWFAEIRLTGPAPYAGLYSAGLTGNFSQPLPGFNLVIADGLQIRFANNLSSTANPLAGVELEVGGTIVTGTAPTGAAVPIATPIQYTFSNASTTVFNGTPESITGFFTFDPLTVIEYGADFVFLDPSGAEVHNCFTDNTPTFSPAKVRALFCNGVPAPGLIEISFANNLSFAADPLASVELPFSAVTDTAPTGEAIPRSGGPILTPEPTSLAILGAALGFFLLSPLAIRRARQSHADSSTPIGDREFSQIG